MFEEVNADLDSRSRRQRAKKRKKNKRQSPDFWLPVAPWWPPGGSLRRLKVEIENEIKRNVHFLKMALLTQKTFKAEPLQKSLWSLGGKAKARNEKKTWKNFLKNKPRKPFDQDQQLVKPRPLVSRHRIFHHHNESTRLRFAMQQDKDIDCRTNFKSQCCILQLFDDFYDIFLISLIGNYRN